MKKMLFLSAALYSALFIGSTHASAEDLVFLMNDLGWTTTIKSKKVQIQIVDAVKDQCWTDTKKATTAVALEMVRSGLIVGDDGPTTVAINAVGYKIGNGPCIAHLDFDVLITGVERRLETGSDGKPDLFSIFSRPVFSRGMILSGGTELSDRLAAESASFAREYLVEMANQKNLIFEELQKSKTLDAQKWIEWVNASD